MKWNNKQSISGPVIFPLTEIGIRSKIIRFR